MSSMNTLHTLHANRQDEQMIDNLYLLLAGMMIEEQTKGEYSPFAGNRKSFLKSIDASDRVKYQTQAVA